MYCNSSSTEILLMSCSSVLPKSSCRLTKCRDHETLRIVIQLVVFFSRSFCSFDSSLVELSMTWFIIELLYLCLLHNRCRRLSKVYICLDTDLHCIRFSGFKWFPSPLLHLFLTAIAFSYFCVDIAEDGTSFSPGWYSISLTCTFLAIVGVSLPF